MSNDDQETEIKYERLVVDDVKDDVQKLLDAVRLIVPDHIEDETGSVSSEGYRKRLNVIMVSLVVAIKAFDQPKDFMMQNISTLYDGISAKSKDRPDTEKRKLN